MSNFKKYLKYAGNLIKHRHKILKTGMKIIIGSEYNHRLQLILCLLVHDLDKFNPKKFVPIAKYLYRDSNIKYEEEQKLLDDYNDAIKSHAFNSAHHPEYYLSVLGVCNYMTASAIIEMYIDWCVNFDNPQKHYIENYNDISLNYDSRVEFEYLLGLNPNFADGIYETIKSAYFTCSYNTFINYYQKVFKRYKIDITNYFPNKG